MTKIVNTQHGQARPAKTGTALMRVHGVGASSRYQLVLAERCVR